MSSDHKKTYQNLPFYSAVNSKVVPPSIKTICIQTKH